MPGFADWRKTERGLIGVEIKGRQTIVLSDTRPMKEDIAAILGKSGWEV